MKQAFYGVRPLLLSVLVAGACNAIAAERVDLVQIVVAAKTMMSLSANSNISAASFLGPSAVELKELRGKA